MMIVFVTSANYISDYQIELSFNTGEQEIVVFSSVIQNDPLAEALTDLAVFKDFYLDPWPTLAWHCGYDIAPETLYFMATGKSPSWMRPQTMQSIHHIKGI
jgi:hypothetical protein